MDAWKFLKSTIDYFEDTYFQLFTTIEWITTYLDYFTKLYYWKQRIKVVPTE